MYRLQTAIVEHTTPAGVHHDWLIEDPRLPNPHAPDAKLWTARVTPPPQHWPKLKRFDFTVIPPHRRIYLDYQGPVSGNRGDVKRLAKGTCYATIWSKARTVMRVQTEHAKLNMQLVLCSEDRWIALIGHAQAASKGSVV
ncbi:MAG: hypothetical protein AAGB26_07090 [Planctomycetota bacterium]